MTFNIDEEAWNKLPKAKGIDPPFLAVRPSGKHGSSTTEACVTYNSFDDVVDFEMCIPRGGACIELVVAIFPSDAYEVSWDGQVIKTDYEFSFWDKYPITSTEIGDFCTPVCDEDAGEALFEYNYWTGGIGLETYRLEDVKANPLLGCDSDIDCKQGLFYSVYKHRACIIRDTCYQFLTGSDRQWIAGYHANAPVFALYFDGELVEWSESWLFKSVTFGGNCPCIQGEVSDI